MTEKMTRQNGSLPMQVRALVLSSVDVAARTIDVIFSTGASVRRHRWEGYSRVAYDETLEVSKAAINMERLDAGAAVLDSHITWSTRAQIAVVTKAWIDGGKAMARLLFPSAGIDEAADRVWGLASEGILRNISVGYSQDEVTVRKAVKDGDIEEWVITRWTPHEISFVTVGADAGAQTRSQNNPSRPDGDVPMFPAVILSTETEESRNMSDKNTPQSDNPAEQKPLATETRQQPLTPPDPTAVVAAERQRMSDITTLARQHGMAESFIDKHLQDGTTVENCRKLILDELAAKSKSTDTPTVRITQDEVDTKRAAIENAVLHRANPSATKLTDAAREWRGMTMMEMGRTYVEETRNVRLRGLGKNEMASVILGLEVRAGMMSTSDFGNLLANVASKRLRDGYGTAVQTWRPFSRQSNAPDFKERAIVMMSGIPEFKKVREGGEFTYADFTDSIEKYALATYGRLIAITRQTIINDDLGAFDRIPQMFGRAAAEFESDTVWNVLLSNPNMGDGVALFHATHGNLAGAGAAPSEAALEAADIDMGKQVGGAGKPLNLKAKYLAVSRKHKVASQKLLGLVKPTKTSDINVYENSYELIVEDRLYNAAGASPWFLIGDPAQWDTLEYAYLDGQEGLYTEQRIGFEVDGIEVKGRLDFAAKAIDHKALYKNPGN